MWFLDTVEWQQRFYKAALDYSQMRGHTVTGISTDVALTVTENAVLIKRVCECPLLL